MSHERQYHTLLPDPNKHHRRKTDGTVTNLNTMVRKAKGSCCRRAEGKT